MISQLDNSMYILFVNMTNCCICCTYPYGRTGVRGYAPDDEGRGEPGRGSRGAVSQRWHSWQYRRTGVRAYGWKLATDTDAALSDDQELAEARGVGSQHVV